jgi:regulator of PEP synthase PpsR (kinase-PPPase family)
MRKRTVFFVSDQTGITAETLGQSLLTQFEEVRFRRITLPFIKSVDKAREAVHRINLTAQVEGFPPIVFATFVQDSLRDEVAKCDGLFLDFFGTFIEPLERELNVKSSHTTGRAHGRADSASYLRRIDAINFAMENDDGMRVDGYDKAEVILVGVSRCGKTPTCLYLALQHGVYAANFPLTEDEFQRRRLPKDIEAYKAKLFGLTIEPVRLRQIRDERRPDSRYASPQQVNFELREAESLYRRYGVPYMDTTHTSVEEIAARVLHDKDLRRRSLDESDVAG